MNLQLDDNDLIPVICQDKATGRVLMLAYTNPGGLKRTLESGQAHFYSRSRQMGWQKGETSGHYLNVDSVWIDCDNDTLLLQVQPAGPACHTGKESCFFTRLESEPGFAHSQTGVGILQELFTVIQDRKEELPEGSYTARLLNEGTARIAQKVIEEAGETALAAVGGKKEALPSEMADLFYHALVLLAKAEVNPNHVWEELRKRRR
jgi:phosphoribosyl-ATP pyrophosphohydrolase/phosphoribosyl-AMP cyclohydrolase